MDSSFMRFNTLEPAAAAELPQSPQYEQVGYDEYIRQLNQNIRTMKETDNIEGLRNIKGLLMNRKRRNTRSVKRLPHFEVFLPQNNVNAEMIRIMTEKYNREHLNTKPIQDYFKTTLVHNEKIRNIEQAIHNIESRPAPYVPHVPRYLREINVDPMIVANSAWKKEQIIPLLAQKEGNIPQLKIDLDNILKEIYADSDRYSFRDIPVIRTRLGRELARLESQGREGGVKWGRVSNILKEVARIEKEILDIRTLRRLLEKIIAKRPPLPASPPSNLIFGPLEGGRRRRRRRTVKKRRS